MEIYCRAGQATQMTVWRMRIACWISEATNIHTQVMVILVYHCNNGCTNAPQWNVIRTLPVFVDFRLFATLSSVDYFRQCRLEGEGGEVGANYWGQAVRKRVRGSNMLHMLCLSQ